MPSVAGSYVEGVRFSKRVRPRGTLYLPYEQEPLPVRPSSCCRAAQVERTSRWLSSDAKHANVPPTVSLSSAIAVRNVVLGARYPHSADSEREAILSMHNTWVVQT